MLVAPAVAQGEQVLVCASRSVTVCPESGRCETKPNWGATFVFDFSTKRVASRKGSEQKDIGYITRERRSGLRLEFAYAWSVHGQTYHREIVLEGWRMTIKHDGGGYATLDCGTER